MIFIFSVTAVAAVAVSRAAAGDQNKRRETVRWLNQWWQLHPPQFNRNLLEKVLVRALNDELRPASNVLSTASVSTRHLLLFILFLLFGITDRSSADIGARTKGVIVKLVETGVRGGGTENRLNLSTLNLAPTNSNPSTHQSAPRRNRQRLCRCPLDRLHSQR